MDFVDQTGDILPGWYSNPNSLSSTEDLLRTTFEHARLLLRTTLKPKHFETLFPPSETANSQQAVSSHSMADVQRCLGEAQTLYECRIGLTLDAFQTMSPTTANTSTNTTAAGSAMNPMAMPTTMTATATATAYTKNKNKNKARIWLTGLAEKVLHYGNIFDVMAQHHPEYVSLAWGTFKLLFIAISNHAETASKLSKSISHIADLLPQHMLHLILYPTPRMQASVARLYAHILHFFLSALKWYNDNRIGHAIKSILQPWDLKFRPLHDAIAAESQQIGRLADVAFKAEVRDTRLQVVQGTQHWEMVKHEMNMLKVENQQLAKLFEAKFGMMEKSIFHMYKEIQVDLGSHRATLNRVHLNQMLSLPLWNSLPTSGESLQYCRSMRNRRRERTKLPLPDVKKLEMWSAQKSNAILLINTYMPVVAKAFMVDVIDLILDHRLPIIWALRDKDYWERCTSAADVVRMLVLQTMQIGAEHLLDGPFPVTVEQLRDAAGLRDWVAILNCLLSNISHAFIVLDADLLAHATAHDRSEALEMLEMLRLKLSGNVKIVTAASSVSRGYTEELERSNACVKLQTGDAGDWRRPRRPPRRPMLRFRKF